MQSAIYVCFFQRDTQDVWHSCIYICRASVREIHGKQGVIEKYDVLSIFTCGNKKKIISSFFKEIDSSYAMGKRTSTSSPGDGNIIVASLQSNRMECYGG